MNQEFSTLTKSMQSIGEEIGHDLATNMIKSHRTVNPQNSHSYLIGRNILERILAQPGCEAIELQEALNEMGKKTLVYLGIDSFGDPILNNQMINEEGKLVNEKAIVADRITTRQPGGGFNEEGDWGWQID